LHCVDHRPQHSSLHDALPISYTRWRVELPGAGAALPAVGGDLELVLGGETGICGAASSETVLVVAPPPCEAGVPASYALPSAGLDRKSTRLNSSHVKISYAVF